jgi:NAD(P)-dependent dehydrogenase (short-subunit alcohol dehydrogenase family)
MPGVFRTAATLAGGAAAAIAVNRLRREQNTIDFHDKVAIVTGGSRGLGLGLAEALARKGAKVAICARDASELEDARRRIEAFGAEIVAEPCNVGAQEDVEQFVRQVRERFGRIDILINNAGIISVGPALNQELEDYRRAMDAMFWGVVHPTLAVLPEMVARGSGSIATITSIGGKFPAPHLAPYEAAKFAAVGFSETLTVDLSGTGVRVTTVVPGLMRTGSYRNALFKGQHEHEYTWFGLGASLPGLTMSVDTAVERILAAVRRGDTVALLDLKTHIATRLHGLMPDSTVAALGLVNRLMPGPALDGDKLLPGHEAETPLTRSFLTAFGREAARRYNQY